jgi:hypothetical protein
MSFKMSSHCRRRRSHFSSRGYLAEPVLWSAEDARGHVEEDDGDGHPDDVAVEIIAANPWTGFTK